MQPIAIRRSRIVVSVPLPTNRQTLRLSAGVDAVLVLHRTGGPQSRRPRLRRSVCKSLKVGVSRLDRASDAVDFVAASKGALTRVVEHAIHLPELVEGGAAARWVIFAKYVAQIPK